MKKRLLNAIMALVLMFALAVIVKPFGVSAATVAADSISASAPQIELEKVLTFDINGEYKSDLRVPGTNLTCSYKIIVPESQDYTFDFKVSSNTGGYISIYTAYFEKKYDSGFLQADSYSDTKFLNAGTYYLVLNLKENTTHGTVCIAPAVTANKISDISYQTGKTAYKNTRMEIEATGDLLTAPRLALNNEFSVDVTGKYDTNVVLGKTLEPRFVKILVTEDGYYTYAFKSANDKGITFDLLDANYKSIDGSHTEKLKTSCLSDTIRLKHGTYFVKMYATDIDCHGSFYLKNKGQEIDDIAFDLDEKEKANTATGILATKDLSKAPRLALGKTYTVDMNKRYGSNISIDKIDNYYVKFLVDKDGSYVYNFKSTNNKAMSFALLDRDYNIVSDSFTKSALSNKAKEGTVTLDAGTYYICINSTDPDAHGTVSLSKKSKPAEDPTYDLKEKAASANSVGVEGNTDVLKAKRLELGKSLSIDVRGNKNANLSVPGVGSYYFFKYIVEKDGEYTCQLGSTGTSTATMNLYNSNFEYVMVTSSLSNKSEKKNVSLTAGTYYLGIYTKETSFTGVASLTYAGAATTAPAVPTVNSLSADKKAFTIKWKTTNNADGYEIRYSTNKSMKSAKTVKVTSASSTSKKVSKLKAKKTYYVQIRAYRTVSGKKYYSAWSKAKSVKTK